MVTVSIKTQAYVNEKRQIIIDLPDNVEVGMVELDLVVRQVSDTIDDVPTREWAQAKLQQAGLLADDHYPDAIEVSATELDRLRQVFAGKRPLSEQIIEDREDRI
jgi:hypothetical protein